MAIRTGVILAALLVACGCSEEGEHHDRDVGGVKHATGFDDPRRFCVDCHGADLRGDRGPSCYSCHDNADHTSLRGGVAHNPAATTLCPGCHGPDGRGGLGPSCYSCHASYPG